MDKAMAQDVSIEVPEKLGSLNVSEAGISTNGPQVRTSARVYKKLRLDPLTSERKDSETKDDENHLEPKEVKIGKTESKSNSRASDQANNTPVTMKIKRSSSCWSSEEKDTFFQALNELGKDFESIHNVFISKAREKKLPENLVKSKEQIRLFYYRTWHKLSKHLKFSSDVKRATQELYALINYGEFRKHVGILTEKTCIKLNDLIHRGNTHFRIRGRHVRLKTPHCPALQKLNKLDVPERKEELQLPTRVVVELRPRTINDWCRVQSVAQNPRVRTLLPLDQRLSSLMGFLQQRWQPPLLQHRDKLLSSVLTAKLQLDVRADHTKEPAPLLHMAPPPGVRITLPTFCVSEYLTSTSLSLSAHRERLANRDALPSLPRRIQTILRRSRNLSRGDAKASVFESTNNKKVSVLGKDVDTLVAAAAAADAKAKASAALAGISVEGISTKDNNVSLQGDKNEGCEKVISSGISNTPGVVPLTANKTVTSSKPSLSSASAVTEASVAETSKIQKVGIPSTIFYATSSQKEMRGNSKVLLAAEQKLESNKKNTTAGKGATQLICLTANDNDSTSLTERRADVVIESDVILEGESEADSEAEGEVQVDKDVEPPPEIEVDTHVGTESEAKGDNKPDVKMLAQIKREKALAKLEAIKLGWSSETAHAVTIGELYLMFGHEGKIELEYWWEERAPLDQTNIIGEKGETSPVASALQKLLSITKLNYRKSKLLCPCGHVCGAPTKTNSRSKAATKMAKEKDDLEKLVNSPGTSHLEKIAPKPQLPPTPPPPPPSTARIPQHMILPTVQDGVFRRPLLAPIYRTTTRNTDVEAIKAELEKFRPRYCNRRGRAVRQKGVVVQRMLPLLPKVPDGHAMLALKVIPQTSTKLPGEFIPIRPQPGAFTRPRPSRSGSLHLQPNNSDLLRQQQSYLAPKLFTSAPVSMPTSNPQGQQQHQLPATQNQQQMVTVSLAPSTTVANFQQNLSNSIITPEERRSPSLPPLSPPPLSSPPPSISHLLDMDLGSTAGDDISLSGVSCGLLDAALASSSTPPPTSQTFSGLLSNEIAEQPSSPPLKLSDQNWLNSEVGDFSLSSLLGNLETPSKTPQIGIVTEDTPIKTLPDVEAQLQCLMSENSVDYSAKFAVLAAQVAASAESKK